MNFFFERYIPAKHFIVREEIPHENAGIFRFTTEISRVYTITADAPGKRDKRNIVEICKNRKVFYANEKKIEKIL